MIKKNRSLWIILGAIVLAIVVGTFTGTTKGIGNLSFYSLYDLIGKLFINALMLVVMPLVSSSIILGIARIGNDTSFRRIGWKTLACFIGTNFLSIFTGFLLINFFGQSLRQSAQIIQQAVALPAQSAVLFSQPTGISQLFLQIIPANILEAFSRNAMLSIIFFSLLFGYAISKIEKEPAAILKAFWQGIFQAMIRITNILMKFLPLGVFCLVAKQFAVTGLDSLRPLAFFLFIVLLGFAIYVFIILPLLLKFIAKVNPFSHFKAMAPALITAFSTSSSSATLPITIDCVEKRAKVSNRICSLVIPLGASLNMAGSDLYAYVASIFIAFAYGVPLTLSLFVFTLVLALFASIGVAGVPSAVLMTIIVILKGLGLPAEGVALILAVDRILDMFRTTVNVFSDSCCAVLIAKTEGEKEVLSE